jgi:hypothetical protein
VTIANGGFAAAVAAQERGNSADAVARGCMAEKEYLLWFPKIRRKYGARRWLRGKA